MDVVDGDATNNSTPIASFDLDFLLDDDGEFTFSRDNAIFVTDAQDGSANLIVKNQIRTTAEEPSKAELFFAHGDPDAGAVTVRFPDAGTADQTIAFGETTSYVAVTPDIHRFEMVDATDGTVLRSGDVDLREKEGQTFTGGLIGIADPEGPEIRIFSNDGDLITVDEGGGTSSISGDVLEDVNYGGGLGRREGVPRPEATVELYRGDGLLASTATDANGRYEFEGLAPDAYVVRVINVTVTSSRP